jgi:release factor glutamine methyltransferase
VLLARREAGEPLEHVVGWAELAGRRYAVEPGVFVPRRRSELLVSAAVARGGPRSVVLDLCCGSGALGAAVAAVLGPGVELHATDVEPAAVRCARRNVPGTVYEGDLFAPLPDRLRHNVDLLLANVPYVPSDEIALMPAEARDHEPRVALDGGTDGLDVLRRVAAEAPVWLAPGGHLLTETSARQAPSAVAVLTRAGLTAGVVHDDDLEATVVIGLLSDQHDRDPTCRSNRVGFDG